MPRRARSGCSRKSSASPEDRLGPPSACYAVAMSAREVSVRELRNHTADVVRRIEAGERLSLTVNRRPVADILPHDPRPEWVPAEVIRKIATEVPSDRRLLGDLDRALGQTLDQM